MYLLFKRPFIKKISNLTSTLMWGNAALLDHGLAVESD